MQQRTAAISGGVAEGHNAQNLYLLQRVQPAGHARHLAGTGEGNMYVFDAAAVIQYSHRPGRPG